MRFRTKVTIPFSNAPISHKDRILMMGSCFAENMAAPLLKSGFQIDVNPFGVIYNPFSLASGIRDLIMCKKYTISDLFEHQGLYHSFSHHSRFSDVSEETCLENINSRIQYSSDFLEKTTIFIITFGTAYTYTLLSNGKIVTNCHKLPDNCFRRERLSVEDIVAQWDQLIQAIRGKNPKVKLIFTVSPIRHWKDGAHENQLSKAILLLSIEELIRQNEGCYYFPAYELVLDELRDYRFYTEDMLHPAPVAIDYIWECFSETFFNEHTKQLISEWQNIQQALDHKPFNPNSQEYQDFLSKTKKRLNDFCSKNPEFGNYFANK